MSDQENQIQQLEEQVRLLTLENDELSEKAEEALLLGLIAEKIHLTDDLSQVTRVGLEQISILKDIPFSSFWSVRADQAFLVEAYCTKTGTPMGAWTVVPPTQLLNTTGPSAHWITETEWSGSDFQRLVLAGGVDAAGALLLRLPSLSLESHFVLLAEPRGEDRLRRMDKLLTRCGAMIATRRENLLLLAALKDANVGLDQKVAERTRSLEEANASLQREVRERKEAQAALRQSEQRFRMLAEASFEGLAFTTEGRFVDVSDNFASMFGYATREVVGRPILDLVAPESREEVSERVRKQSVEAYECVGLHRDGRHFPMEVRVRTATVGARNLRITAVRDISARKQAEEERRTWERQLREAQKMESLGILAGGVAHDFNNLLTAILGNASLIKAELPPQSPLNQGLEDIETGASRAADLCRQLLAYAGKGRLQREALHLNQLVSEMARLIQVSVSKKITLQYQLAEDLPLVEADANQLRQVVMNLIINASEAIGDQAGVISFTTSAVTADLEFVRQKHLMLPLVPGRLVLLEVADTGCGMTPEVQARVFEPFYTTKFTGRGLGLSAVIGLVKAHSGSLGLVSVPGKGTRFQIYLPASPEESIPSHRGPSPLPWRSSGLILVVDDEVPVALVARRILERCGFEVLTAKDGLEAIELFRAHGQRVRCVLLDLIMPRMDGVETLRELRRLKSDTPVILSSGYSEEEVSSRFAQERVEGLVEKPFRIEALIRKVQEVLKEGPG